MHYVVLHIYHYPQCSKIRVCPRGSEKVFKWRIIEIGQRQLEADGSWDG
jgi:hypothetical protein